MRKNFWFLSLVFSLVLVCLGFYLVKANQKEYPAPVQKDNPAYGQSITLHGHSTCLEYKSQKHVDFCAGGFSSGSKVYKLETEEYYRTHRISFFGSDEYVVTGILQPPGKDAYVSDGTINVTDIKLVE